jgi:Ca2+-binding RTX toxin-like protein
VSVLARPVSSRLLVVVALVVAGAALALMATPAAQATVANGRLAQLLLRRDPGARVGGDTQVATADGTVLLGVPGRINFMMALGNHERLIGGNIHDELGAYNGTRGVRIYGRGGNDLLVGMRGDQLLDGGPGTDAIYGGPGNDIIYGGPGDDQIVDRQGRTVVFTGSGRDFVDVADGHGDDQVVCAPGSVGRVLADPGDRVDRRCHRQRASTGSPATDHPPFAHAAQPSVGGDGSNANPFVSACSDEQDVDCLVNAFPARSLSGLWANEYVPSYVCNTSDHPYLLFQNYAPGGTALPFGVGVVGLGPIGVSITGIADLGNSYATGTLTGAGDSSATNWTLGTNSYRVELHCSSNQGHGYTSP